MKVVLIITSTIDYTIDYFIIKYGKNVRMLRLNVDMFDKYQIDITENNWKITTDSWSICRDAIFSIYYRKPRLPDLSNYEGEYQSMIQKDIIATIVGLVDSFNGIVLSKPSILRKTENKIYQLQKGKEIGFNVPKTIITNNADLANGLLSKEKTIIKPITTGKIQIGDRYEIYQTNILDELLNDISITPVYLQEYIPKLYEVRLTIINGYFYGVKIQSSNEIDWRDEQADNKYIIIDVPVEIKNKCNKMLNKFNLNFGAFDFIVNRDLRWIFLEVNPNGQWLWLEQILNLNISEKIIEFLTGG